jgi:nicotinamide-nucleotide adenylyltransferase
MMALFARSLHERLLRETGIRVSVDVGVTKKAFFSDKAAALEGAGEYEAPEGKGEGEGEGGKKYVQQTHLVGFDTLVRLFDKKYYGEEGLRVLGPFLEMHRVRAMLRADGKGREEVERQRSWLEGLKGEEGFEERWLRSVEVVEGGEEAEGVSSTRVREAVKREDWEEVKQLVGEETGVEAWVRERGLYAEDKEKERL